MPDALAWPCPAKINLALAVGQPLPPDHPRAGMHPIASWFAPIALADTLSVTRLAQSASSHYTITRADRQPVDWPIDHDLAVRAHRALEQFLSRTLPIHLDLTKHIPPGTGLGGGSSNAASTLLALNQLFELNIPHITLARIASNLGSDIAFFIDDQPPRPALVTGLGEQIERLPPLQLPILLILPPFACHTPAVYRTFDTLAYQPAHLDHACTIARTADTQQLFNDLWPAAQLVAPQLTHIHARATHALSAPVHLSGSGSALFAIAPADHANALARALPECIILSTHTLAPTD